MIFENFSIILSVIAVGILGLAYSFWQSYKINKLESVNQKISDSGSTIKKGVNTYIAAEYKFLILFAVSLALLSFFYGRSQQDSNGLIAASLIIGAIFSAIAGYASIRIATTANSKVTSETQKSYSNGFITAFSAGTSVGIIGVSSLVLGLGVLFTSFYLLKLDFELPVILNVIAGYALGATSMTLFARFGGAIFSKGADIAENEIITNEPGIKEDSAYNAASVANQSGQSISNIGGISLDIFESFAAAIIACLLLSSPFVTPDSGPKATGLFFLPLIIASIGILTSTAGSFLLRSSDISTSRKVINYAEAFAAMVLTIASFFAIKYLIPTEWEATTKTETELITTTYKSLGIFWSALFGIGASVGIGYITEFYTSKVSPTIKHLVDKSSKGPAHNLLGGLEAGFISTGFPLALLVGAVIASYYFSGFYGVAIAAVGFLANAGLQLTFNAFAPIADNSKSIAVKSNLEEETIKQCNNLKQTGIQSIVQGKIYLVLAASLSSLALFGALVQLTGLTTINAANPLVLISMLVGVLLPFLLSSISIAVVGRVSKKIVKEVQRQFIDNAALGDAKEILDKFNGDLTTATEGEKEIVYSASDSADNEQCIEIAAYASIWETLIPGIIAISAPVLISYFAGAEILAGLLLGVIGSSTVTAIYQANTGSALESSKYALEDGIVINGELIQTNSAAYQASQIGNLTGKSLKDVSSPAMTVMMKIMIIVSIVLIPLLINKKQKRKALHVQNELIIKQQCMNKGADNTTFII